MVMYITIILDDFFFSCEFKILKILIARYENVLKFLKAMLKFVWIWL
jgi:hypothetical protein